MSAPRIVVVKSYRLPGKCGNATDVTRDITPLIVICPGPATVRNVENYRVPAIAA